MNAVLTRAAFQQYLLTSLGAPIINIEVTPAHVDMAIDQALKKFWSFHRNGTSETHFVYTVQAADVANGWIPTPEGMDSVAEVLPKGLCQGEMGWASFEWQMEAGAMASANGMTGSGVFSAPGNGPGGSSGGNSYQDTKGNYNQITLADFYLAQQQIDFLRRMTGADTRSFNFSRYQRRLTPLFRIQAGEFIVMRAYINVDPEASDTDLAAASAYVWEDDWLKDYARAELKIIWGGILRKHGGIALPGGVLLDGQTLVDEGTKEAADLLEAIQNEYPVGFYIG